MGQEGIIPSVVLSLDSDKMKDFLKSEEEKQRDTYYKEDAPLSWGMDIPKNNLSNNIKLYFKNSDKKEIYINATCNGFINLDKKLKLRWECYKLNERPPLILRETREVVVDDKSPYVVVKVPESELGYKLEIRATAYYEGDIEKKEQAINSIFVCPTITPRKISDSASWFYMKDGNWYQINDTLLKAVKATVTVSGYNNEYLSIGRYAKINGKERFIAKHNLIVKGNKIDVRFNRSEIAPFAKPGDKVELVCDIDNGNKITSKKLTIPKTDPVKPVKGSVSQPALTGDYTIEDNNFKICKYTKIEAEYEAGEKKEKKSLVIFQENTNGGNSSINLIGGKRKVDIKLSEYTAKECRLKAGKHTQKATLIAYNKSVPELIAISDGGELSKEFEYEYDGLMLGYIWPSRKKLIQKHILKVQTCRYVHKVPINVYPDIEWELCLVFNADIGSQLLANKGWSINKLKDEKFESPQKGLDLNFAYKFKLGYECNDTNSKDEITWGTQFKKTIEFLALFEYYFNSLFKLDNGAPEINKEVGETPNLDNYKKGKDFKIHLPIRGYLCTPELVLGIKWSTQMKNNSDVCTSVKLFAKFDPLLSIGVVFDIIAIAGKFPRWGTVIDGVRKFLNKLDAEINFCIGVYGTAKVEGEIATDGSGNLLKATAEAEIKILLEADYDGKWIIVKVYFKAECYGKGGIFIEFDFGVDDTGIYYQILPGNTSCELGYKLSGGMDWKGETEDEETSYSTTEINNEAGYSGEGGNKIVILEKGYWGDTENRQKYYIDND